ncbi:hypothetical protein NLI96_g9150 [Meripilus lineatus]|uniref:Uncharacterized protein n=1 Tax=Meripilus lineatus TaxID=2056292 RepID=A0AAD5UVZ5_9APHY|nr:hypothetical protein NLI96_g9150 [Physisporinus lineatus]
MGQSWDIFDVDNKVKIEYLGKLGESLFDESCDRLATVITRFLIKESPIVVHYLRATTGLLKLPLEIIDAILESVEDFKDAAALVMTNKMLYSLGFKAIQRRLAKIAAPSVGNRIVCHGRGTCGRDLPPGLTEKDWQEAVQWVTENPGSDYGADEDLEETCSYPYYADKAFPKLPDWYHRVPNDWRLMSGWEYAPRFDRKIGGPKWEKALRELLQVHKPSSENLVLCNLTKRVYVDGLKADQYVKHDIIDRSIPFLFGAILMCHICWSTASDVAFWYEGKIHRGVWAGHRFEITTKDRLKDIKPIEGGVQDDWKDVTKEAMKETNRVAKAYTE